MATQGDIDAVITSLQQIRQEAEDYFDRLSATDAVKAARERGGQPFSDNWEAVPAEFKESANKLGKRLKVLILAIIEACKTSPLTDETDIGDLRFAMKRMSAALLIRCYYQADAEVLHDEGAVLGVRPAHQEEQRATVGEAKSFFWGSYNEVSRILDLASPQEHGPMATVFPDQVRGVSKHRVNTAFIMMMMDRDKPELEDVHNCFKEVFNKYKIKAIRSDDIEHEDVITTRILNEISTSEFLIADLTGERPSVYYEVGFAHAVGKRPILYRKKGTTLHFDLAVHNVPEYENITDLRTKLDKRLAALMNKQVTD